MLLPVCDNIPGNRLAYAGYIFQQGCGRRIQIHADFVDTVLHNSVQRLAKLLLVTVMLILSDPDGLRINLDQLRERILQAPCNGRRASLPDIKVREFLRRQPARGIYRRAGLIDDDILYLIIYLLKQLHNHLLRLP